MFSYKKAKNVLALTAALSVLCSQSVFAATLELDLEVMDVIFLVFIIQNYIVCIE